MRKKNISIILGLSVVLLTIYTTTRLKVADYRHNFAYRQHAASLPLPLEMVGGIASEFKGLTADYLYLEAASFVGSEDATSDRTEDWNSVAQLLNQSSYLDPYFKSTYRLGQATLPWNLKKYDVITTILNRSKKHREWDWEPGFFLGFNYFYFLKDNLSASREMMAASKRPDAPITLATLSARLSMQAHQTETAIEFLSAMYEKTDDENTKKTLEERIIALKGVAVLQAAVDRYKNKFQRVPNDFDELVSESILTTLPVNPYGRPFTLNKDGTVSF